jgi:phosphatidylserine/phosphatidylglycerophosphate/cardiolipin synthase-like enzyme
MVTTGLHGSFYRERLFVARRSFAESAANSFPLRPPASIRYCLFIHHKFLVIDGQTVETGSFNFTKGPAKRTRRSC